VTVPREPAALEADAMALVPAVCAALELWDTLKLEVGEAAVVTDGHPWSRAVALVASWYGALPVVLISDDAASVPGVIRVSTTGAPDPVRELVVNLQGRPAVAAAELSGRADAVDLLLEALPASSRVMLAGAAREPLTIDYYVNVHRKGLRLVSGMLDAGPMHAVDAGADARAGRARRLLARPARLAACREAMR